MSVWQGPTTIDDVELALDLSLREPVILTSTRRQEQAGYAREPVTCVVPTTWHPTLWVVQQHHHPALSWRREILRADPEADTSWWTLGGWCGLCHDAYHTLLNMYVRAAAQGREAVEAAESEGWIVNRAALESLVPPWSVRRTFGVFVREHCAEAWAKRPPVTPWT